MCLKQSNRDTERSGSHQLVALVAAAAGGAAAVIALLINIFNQDCLPARRKELHCCFSLQEDKQEECPAAT